MLSMVKTQNQTVAIFIVAQLEEATTQTSHYQQEMIAPLIQLIMSLMKCPLI